jgi:AcrR family transcriptional regulator
MTRAASLRAPESRSTRDAILDVAERRFAEKGFAAVSMREISAEAGLRNQASLYHHFRHKRALYEAVLARGVGRLAELVGETRGIGQDDVLDRVIDYLVEHPHLPRLIQRAGLDDTRSLGKAAIRVLEPLWARGVEALSRSSHRWRPEELPNLAAGLYHLIFGYFANAALLEAILEEDLSAPAAIARQRRFLKSAVASLLGGRPELVKRPRRT